MLPRLQMVRDDGVLTSAAEMLRNYKSSNNVGDVEFFYFFCPEIGAFCMVCSLQSCLKCNEMNSLFLLFDAF